MYGYGGMAGVCMAMEEWQAYVWLWRNGTAAEIAISFYKNCLDHNSIGKSLRMAKEKAYEGNNIAWTCFILFGDPTLPFI